MSIMNNGNDLVPQNHSRLWVDMLKARETHSFKKVQYGTKLAFFRDVLDDIDNNIEVAITDGNAEREQQLRILWDETEADIRVASKCVRALGALHCLQ